MTETMKGKTEVNKAKIIIGFVSDACIPVGHAVVVISSKNMQLMRLHNNKPCDVDRINGSGRAINCLVSGAMICRDPKREEVWVVHNKQGEMSAFLYNGISVFPEIKSLRK